jgi:hypothetical protein
MAAMDKNELKSIRGFLAVVGTDADGPRDGAVLSDRLSELSRIIHRLMKERLGTANLRAKVHMATLERRARRCRRKIEANLGNRHASR